MLMVLFMHKKLDKKRQKKDARDYVLGLIPSRVSMAIQKEIYAYTAEQD